MEMSARECTESSRIISFFFTYTRIVYSSKIEPKKGFLGIYRATSSRKTRNFRSKKFRLDFLFSHGLKHLCWATRYWRSKPREYTCSKLKLNSHLTRSLRGSLRVSWMLFVAAHLYTPALLLVTLWSTRLWLDQTILADLLCVSTSSWKLKVSSRPISSME